jgi:hypothetical protein
MRQIELISAANAAATVTSVPAEIGDLTNYSIELSFGTLPAVNGVAKLQASNNTTTWIDIPSSSQTIALGAAHMWNVTAAGYKWVRVVFTPTKDVGLSYSSTGSGPYTATITKTAHGMLDGSTVYLSNGSDADINGTFVISNVAAGTFDVETVADPTSGTVDMLGSGSLTAALVIKEPSNRH